MLELAGDRVDPGYIAARDRNVTDVGGGLFIGIPAGAYLRSVERNGSPAFTLDELREQPEELRRIADITLADAIGLQPTVAGRPGDARRCQVIAPGSATESASFPLRPGRTTYAATGSEPVAVGLRRFADDESGALEEVPTGAWRGIEIARDAAPEPWLALIDGPMRVCFPR